MEARLIVGIKINNKHTCRFLIMHDFFLGGGGGGREGGGGPNSYVGVTYTTKCSMSMLLSNSEHSVGN